MSSQEFRHCSAFEMRWLLGCEPTMLSISFGYFYFIHNAMECIFYLFKILDN